MTSAALRHLLNWLAVIILFIIIIIIIIIIITRHAVFWNLWLSGLEWYASVHEEPRSITQRLHTVAVKTVSFFGDVATSLFMLIVRLKFPFIIIIIYY